jgi:hypothetical protein
MGIIITGPFFVGAGGVFPRISFYRELGGNVMIYDSGRTGW